MLMVLPRVHIGAHASNRLFLAAPLLFGSAWILVAQLPVTPLWNAVLRVAPAGMLLLALHPTLPNRQWLARSLVLGMFNFGGFFALQAFAAHRLPSGVAATVASSQALLVPFGALILLSQPIRWKHVAAAGIGVGGIGLLATSASGPIDQVGVAACLANAVCGAVGLLLTRRWGTPSKVPHTTATAWQMIGGVLPLAPLAMLIEGPPIGAHQDAIIGIAVMLILACTAVPFALLFGALHSGVPAVTISRVMLLTPVAAAAGGWMAFGQALTALQMLGAGAVLCSVALACRSSLDRAQKGPPVAIGHSSSGRIGRQHARA